MQKGDYYYAIENGICIIKPVGSITVPLCGGIDAFLSRIFAENTIADMIIDMTETEYIDSTNLGVLLRIKRHYSQSKKKCPVIVTSEGAIEKILLEVSFDKLFTIIKQEHAPREGEFRHLPPEEKQEEELRQIIMKAHYNLMSIDEKNRERFSDIVTLLDNDPDKRPIPKKGTRSGPGYCKDP